MFPKTRTSQQDNWYSTPWFHIVLCVAIIALSLNWYPRVHDVSLQVTIVIIGISSSALLLSSVWFLIAQWFVKRGGPR